MRIEWDEDKRRANLRRHGFDFVGAEAIFEGDTLTVEDTRQSYGERRWITIGTLEGRVVVLVHSDRVDAVRLISLRKATKYEQKAYFEHVPH